MNQMTPKSGKTNPYSQKKVLHNGGLFSFYRRTADRFI